MTPDVMTAARVPRRGGPEFQLVEMPVPAPAPGQILIRVESAAVNFSDIKRRRGDAYPFPTEFPFVPGGEVAGEVVAHGAGVSAPPIGARVFALAGANGFGGYAQYAVSYATTAVPIPDGMTADAASVVMVAGCTAALMLGVTARLVAGESVLVPAAAGGVGSFAIQIARRLGAGRIIAAVSTTDKALHAKALGADVTVDSTDAGWPTHVLEATGGRGVDVALEATGEGGLEQTLRCLGHFGRLVVFGAASGNSARLGQTALDALLYAPAANQSIAGFNIGTWFLERPQVAGPALVELVRALAASELRAPAIETLPLSRAREAHVRLEGRKVIGKLVLKPWE